MSREDIGAVGQRIGGYSGSTDAAGLAPPLQLPSGYIQRDHRLPPGFAGDWPSTTVVNIGPDQIRGPDPLDQPDLIAWLREQLDEDAAEIAKHPDGEDDGAYWSITATGETGYPCNPYLRIGKDRALAEVAAKRAHIARWEGVNRLLTEDETPGVIRNELLSVRRAYALVIADDALPYADREGYRQEWRP